MEGRSVTLGGMFRPGMRGYIVPLVAGVALTISAFLPWVIVGEVTRRGVPDVWALWVAGLGVLAAVLATLSMITRKNSRHPLLVVGLCALAIMFLAWRIVPRTVEEGARTWAQAVAIADGVSASSASNPHALVGIGIYLGLGASAALVLFGLTIVVKRASRPYVVESPDDDV
jgi:steroid 5-alpha reductase family enzyme